MVFSFHINRSNIQNFTIMKYSTLLRSFIAAIALSATVQTVSAQSFTVRLKDGATQSYNTSDIERISFSPDNYDPSVEDKAVLFETPANTYIVSRSGDYAFYPVLPSGKEISGLAKVDWIWAQKQTETDTEQKLVDDVRLDGDKVRFTATGNYGNVALAGFNDEGTIVWVWLLWMTPQPEEREFDGGSVFLDRLMGATSGNAADGKRTWGAVVYQWGRPVPIFGGYAEEYEKNGETFNEARKWTVMNPKYNLEWKVEKTNATIEEAIAAPTTFFAGANANWLAEADPELWGAEKTDYDPSPAGYTIPMWTDWGESFFDHLNIIEDESGAFYSYNGADTYFPHGNLNRLYDTGENVIGYSGYMSWNREYYLDDSAGFIDDPNCPWSLEQLLQMGLVSYAPSRIDLQFHDSGFTKTTNTPANPSFAIPVRCVKVKTSAD